MMARYLLREDCGGMGGGSGAGRPRIQTGVEWVVEAGGCRPAVLRSRPLLSAFLRRLLREANLHLAGRPVWKKFPPPGGLTALFLLRESHLACHTYPEHALATFNLYCCRPRPAWPWAARLRLALGARRVRVRRLSRRLPPAGPAGRAR